MVWFSEGYLFKLGALDFAGGTVVHINSGVAGLVGAFWSASASATAAICSRRIR